MGQYEPTDSRKVTLQQGDNPGEPSRTGPREGETRRDDGEHEGEKTSRSGGEAEDGADERAEEGDERQSGYGNSRTKDGQSDKDMRDGDKRGGEKRGDASDASAGAHAGTSVGLSGEEIAPGDAPEQPLSNFAARSVRQPG